MSRKWACAICHVRWCVQGWATCTVCWCFSWTIYVSVDPAETSWGIISECWNSTSHIPGAYGEQLQCRAFLLKNEAHKKPTSNIDVKWSVVSPSSHEYRVRHSAWDKLPRPSDWVCQEESTKSFADITNRKRLDFHSFDLHFVTQCICTVIILC